jgi:hypothetical protein
LNFTALDMVSGVETVSSFRGRRTVCDCLLAPMMMHFSDERARSEDWEGGGCSLSTVRVVNNAIGA